MIDDNVVLKADYHKLIQSLERHWLANKNSETFEQLIERGMSSYRFSSDINEEQLRVIQRQLNIDLMAFIKDKRQNPTFKDSPHYLAIETTIWQWALAISDKCQLEWLELSEDIKHDGLYQAGDVVGLGQFLCTNCSQTMAIYHPDVLTSCNHCLGVQFRRIAFKP
jgi:hypothetical protein